MFLIGNRLFFFSFNQLLSSKMVKNYKTTKKHYKGIEH